MTPRALTPIRLCCRACGVELTLTAEGITHECPLTLLRLYQHAVVDEIEDAVLETLLARLRKQGWSWIRRRKAKVRRGVGV